MTKRLFLLVIIGFFLLVSAPVRSQVEDEEYPTYIVCAIGDSHVTRHSPLVSALSVELGEDYEVWARGRRGWTSARWIRSGDFASECAGADVVLISLGGNDRNNGRSWSAIRENVATLIATLPPGAFTYHMPVPRFYRPRVPLAPDGVHLTRGGATIYARMIAPHLRVAD